MKKTALTLLILAYALISQAQRNVVLIIADDLGSSWCGFYEDHADTAALPNIRTLLNKGVRFQNATANPVCSPTRAGILTGRYSFRTGVGCYIGSSGELDTAETTIPRLLKIYNQNIGSAQVGKWHLHTQKPAHFIYPNIMGYNYFAGSLAGLSDYYNWPKITNGVKSTVTNYATTETVNDAVNWIKSQNNNQFFLWAAFNAPHTPYHLPPAGMYSDTTLTGTPSDISANPKKYFRADLEALDHEIGRLFDSLTVLNKMDSTDFIFIGDNGNVGGVAADPSRGKGTMYQGGTHVPFIIAGPSVVNPGRVSSALVNTVDLFATILELFGYNNWQSQISINKPVDTKSIMPVVLNQGASVRPWAFTEIFKDSTDSKDGKAIRNIDYKLINFDYGNQELYNLTIDSSESNNLLTGVLSSSDTANYNYLCTEMTNLLGTGNYCNAAYVIPTIAITASSTTICSGTNVTFSSTVTNGGVSPIYQWKKNGNNVGTNDSLYSDNALANGDVISCLLTTAVSTSATSNTVTMAVSTAVPAKPGLISGNQYNLCLATNETYSVSIVSNAVSYIWSVPANATLVSGQGTNSIVISCSSLFKHGIISVKSSNYCGVSAMRTRYVYAKTEAPGAIAGPNSVCTNQNEQYSIAPVTGATSYKWVLPTGSSIKSGQGTTSIVAKVGINAGNITVVAKNSCAGSNKSILPITINCKMNIEESYDQNDLNVINPFTNKIIFSVNSDISNTTVSLLDLMGREICIWKNVSLFENEQQELPIDKNLPDGIYLLTIKNSKVNLFSKVNHQ